MRRIRFLFVLLIFIILINACKEEVPPPKNVIVFIADGCGYNQVAAAEMFAYGATNRAVFQNFPVKYAMSTFPADGLYEPQKAWKSFEYVMQRPTDSAASATALATGVKTKNGKIGVDSTNAPVTNIIEIAEQVGKSTGVVTTVPFSHATPAGFVVHNESRRNYHQIAQTMIFQSRVDVIMGAGHPEYDNDGHKRKKPVYKFIADYTFDALREGEAGNDADGDGLNDFWTLIEDSAEFAQLVSGPTPKRVFGLAQVGSTLQQDRSGDPKAAAFAVPFNKGIPDLKTMTLGALNVLDDDPDGFFLMVEGGAVDWAGHANNPGRLIEEKLAFDQAIEAAVNWINTNSSWEETLVIVTGDHETGYLTGPGAKTDYSGSSELPIEQVWPPLLNNGKGEMPGMEFHTHEHTNSLIPFYAKGQGSELFKNEIDGHDPVRGAFIDNSDVGKVLIGFYQTK